MKKVLLKFNKFFLLFLAIICTNNIIFAQEYEAKMTSKKLYEYIINKKQKKNHTLKIKIQNDIKEIEENNCDK